MNTLLAINVRAVTYGLRLTLGLLLIVMLSGCGSSVKVVADHDPATDFSAYRTYQWMPEPEDTQMQRGFIWRDIKQSIDHDLGQRSMQQVESNPDVYVAFYASVEEKVTGATIDRYGYGYGGYWGRGRWGTYGGGTAQVRVDSYTEGTLIVDIIDAGKKELVWRSVATGAVRNADNPQKAREKIPEVVAQVMEDYPPGAGM